MPQNAKDFHDSYGILPPRKPVFFNCPHLSALAVKTRPDPFYRIDSGPTTIEYGKKFAYCLMYALKSRVTMKMLALYADDCEHHYEHICKQLNIPYGNDIDCWRSLIDRELIALSSKSKTGKKFYKITSLGHEVLEIAEANQVYHRVARWFKVKGDPTIEMMKADLNGEESWKDQLPEAYIDLLEALFNPASRVRQIGSAYRWMNNVMYLAKTSPDFLEKLYSPEVQAWLSAHVATWPGIAVFMKKIARFKQRKDFFERRQQS